MRATMIKSLLSLSFVTLAAISAAGCSSFPYLVVDDRFPGGEWAQLALTIEGQGANGDKVNACKEEARLAGIHLVPTAPTRATVHFSDHENWVQVEGQPMRFPIGKWMHRAQCRVVLAKA